MQSSGWDTGRPGCGKTWVARTVAGELNVPALELGRIEGRYVGESQDNLRRAFEAIRVNLPAMLLSGLLLPMSLAPGWLAALSRLMPLRYLVDAVRSAFVGDWASGTVALGAAVAAALVAVAVVTGVRGLAGPR